MDLPQVYMQDSPNAIKNFKKGRIKGGKFTIDPAESTLPSLDDRFQNINWSSSYFQPPVEEANNNMGIIFIEMVRLLMMWSDNIVFILFLGGLIPF